MTRLIKAVLLGIVGVFLLIQLANTVQIMNRHSIALGVYDPHQAFQHPEVLIEHHFVPWRLDNAKEVEEALQSARYNHRLPMITLEPWPWNWNGMTSDTLFQDILSGKYDRTIERILNVLKQQSPQKILFRWAHEMEIVDQYPWSKEDSNSYIQSYRYVVNYARRLGLSNILWVWSPAGNRTARLYYPGADYVDYVGISIYATKEWNTQNSNQVPSFSKLISEKYWVANHFNKPMIISEVGVAGSDDAISQWITDAIHSLAHYPRIKAWVYFNQVQPHIVPLPIGFPDWELSQQQIRLLTSQWEAYNKNRLGADNIQAFITSRGEWQP
ncbi:glycoside hydrolase family 26 protein [Thermoleptolyngbya sp.]